ncbi:MAG TPA: FHA domain-containing protein, partial [Firmicutes bacterium]|nr:FHA domain-containing protein [Bacillota bacterium]
MPIKIQVLNFKGVGFNTYVFNKEQIRLGRSPENDLVLKDGDVSRNHAKIVQTENDFYIEDHNSMNGTWLYKDGAWDKIDKTAELSSPSIAILGVNILLKFEKIDGDNLQNPDTDILSEPSTSVLEPGFEKERYCGIMVLDLCDSTKIANINEKEAYQQKVELNRIAMPIFFLNEMIFYKGTGDGFITTFKAPLTALNVALKLSEQILKYNSGLQKPGIRFRVSLHYGKIYYTDSERTDVHGNDVNLAFRIEGVKEESFIQQIS